MDHTASKRTDPQVVEAMLPYMTEYYGNPSSLHIFGQKARESLNEARESVASLIGAKSEEVIFTSGATESNNLAIQGVAFRNRKKGNQLVTTTIEHMSVMNTFKHLTKYDFSTTFVPVDGQGVVDLKGLEEAITNQTILVSVMYANGEIGTIEPIREISKIAHERGAYFHVDAVAAAGLVPIDVERDGVDFLSLSSNDLYGPKGVGALYIRKGVRIEPIIQGGGQERGLRSGTENIPEIVGMGKAAEIARTEMDIISLRLAGLKNRLIEGVLSTIPETYLNGHPTNRLPDNSNLRFSYIEGESLILSLDFEGIATSSGSACTSKTLEPSHVLTAIGLRHEEAHGSLLFTLGRENTMEDVDYVLGVLPKIVKRLREISPLTPKELLR